MGLICLGTGKAALETSAASKFFGLLEYFVPGLLVKQVVVVEPFKQISGNRISKIYTAFLFQGTNPSVTHILSSPCPANLDPKDSFQLKWARITLAMEKVLGLSDYLFTVLTFSLVSHNQSCRRPFPPSAYALWGVLRSLAPSKCQVNLTGVNLYLLYRKYIGVIHSRNIGVNLYL